MDRRRFLLTSLVGVLASLPGADAQHAVKVWRIGLLVPGLPPGCDRDSGPAALLGLQDGFRELGYVETRNYVS